MINYRISGGDNEIIDFKKALLDINLDNSDDYCLIDNIKLEPEHVKLDCGHKFNYEAIFKHVIGSKNRGVMMDYRLQLSQVQCPYCRHIQNTLLPLPPKDKDIELVDGVNWIDVKKHFGSDVVLNTDNTPCECRTCFEYIHTITNTKINKTLCYKHYKIYHSKLMKEKRALAKEKESSKNVVVSLTSPSHQVGSILDAPKPVMCGAMVKSGVKKGTTCDCFAFYLSVKDPNVKRCGRHKNY